MGLYYFKFPVIENAPSTTITREKLYRRMSILSEDNSKYWIVASLLHILFFLCTLRRFLSLGMRLVLIFRCLPLALDFLLSFVAFTESMCRSPNKSRRTTTCPLCFSGPILSFRRYGRQETARGQIGPSCRWDGMFDIVCSHGRTTFWIFFPLCIRIPTTNYTRPHPPAGTSLPLLLSGP